MGQPGAAGSSQPLPLHRPPSLSTFTPPTFAQKTLSPELRAVLAADEPGVRERLDGREGVPDVEALLGAAVDELEELRREKVRQEFEQKNRQQAEKKAERERAAVPQDFRAMAAKREAKASGWSDRGEQWKAAPQGLRTLIDGYNAAPKEMRPAILDRILNDGQRREQVRELMAEQRQQYRANDRGMER